MSKKKKVIIGVIAVTFLCVIVGLLSLSSEKEASVRTPKSTNTAVVETIESTNTSTPTALPTKISTRVLTPKPTKDPNLNNSSLAAIMCREFMLDLLISPSTAEFPGWLSDWPKVVPYLGDTTGRSWEVGSYVDSQNSFGAMIRTSYVCNITYVGDDMWELIYPIFINE